MVVKPGGKMKETTEYLVSLLVTKMVTNKNGIVTKRERLANISGIYDDTIKKSIEIALDELEKK